ncbi:MAG: PAS domain S-box protein, partial [Proteobacteria bacterium]|nr:PAS domain S-box protein [Pseudomonadota bacterium]
MTTRDRLHKLMEVSPDGWLLVNDEGLIIFANGAIEEIFGYAIDELMGQPIELLVPKRVKNHVDLRKKYLDQASTHLKCTRLELHAQKRNGEAMDLELSLVPFTNEGELCVSAMLRNITLARVVTRTLEENHFRLLQMQQLTQMGHWEYYIAEDRLQWSEEVYRIFGVAEDDFEPQLEYFLNAIHRDDRDKVTTAYSRSLVTKEPYDIVHRIVRPNGDIRFVRERCRTYWGGDGKPYRSLGVVVDITAQHETEQTLANYRDHLEDLVRKRTAQLELNQRRSQLLEDVAATANAADTVEQVLRIALELVACHMNWPVGHAYITSKSNKNSLIPTDLWYIAEADRYEQLEGETSRLSFAPLVGMPGRVMATKKAWCIPDIEDEIALPRARVLKASGLKGAYGFPVVVGNEVVAVLEFFSERIETADEVLLETMSRIGFHLGIVVQRKRAELALSRTLALERAISKISSRFVKDDDFERTIDKALDAVGRAGKAARAYLFQLDANSWLTPGPPGSVALRPGNGSTVSNTHEWCAEGVTPGINQLKQIPIAASPWWADQLYAGEPICLED